MIRAVIGANVRYVSGENLILRGGRNSRPASDNDPCRTTKIAIAQGAVAVADVARASPTHSPENLQASGSLILRSFPPIFH